MCRFNDKIHGKVNELLLSFLRTVKYHVFLVFRIEHRRITHYVPVVSAVDGAVFELFMMLAFFTVFNSHSGSRIIKR